MTKIKSGSKPAKRGYLYENKFVELVNKNEKFNQSLKRLLKIKGRLKAKRITDNRKKTDVKLIVDNKKEIGLSIKTAEANFNQLERVWLRELARRHNMPKNIENKVNECLREKSKNRKGKFILDKYRDGILDYFKKNLKPILKDIFSKNEENLKYLAVCVFVKDRWHIALMDEVIKEISKSGLSTTVAGVIKIGDYLTLQRKGGDGAHVKLPKSDPRHPGNQLQFKIKPISLLDLNIFQEIKY